MCLVAPSAADDPRTGVAPASDDEDGEVTSRIDDDEAGRDVVHWRWAADPNRSTNDPGYDDGWYAEQCGGCHFWLALAGPLGADWGLCANADAPFDGRSRFEHDGCAAHMSGGWR